MLEKINEAVKALSRSSIKTTGGHRAGQRAQQFYKEITVEKEISYGDSAFPISTVQGTAAN